MDINPIKTKSIAPTFTANLSPSVVPFEIDSKALLPKSDLFISNFCTFKKKRNDWMKKKILIAGSPAFMDIYEKPLAYGFQKNNCI